MRGQETNKSVVLLSGGMDSSVNLMAAHEASQVVLALTFDYGQRAAASEIEVTRRLTARLKIPHQILKLPFFEDFGISSLLQSSRLDSVPVGQQVSIDSLERSQETARAVWVPNRNGIFLNIAAGFCESLKAHWIVPGFNKEEATTFPDNSKDFLKATTSALAYSTSNQVQVKCFTTEMTKSEIVILGQQLKFDWTWMWPCYFSGDRWCGQCESCLRSKRALQSQQIPVENFFAR